MIRRVLIGGNEAYKVEYWRVFEVVKEIPKGVVLTKTDVIKTVPDDSNYHYFHYEVGFEQHYICILTNDLFSYGNIKTIFKNFLKDTCFHYVSMEVDDNEDIYFYYETKTPSEEKWRHSLCVYSTGDESSETFEKFWKRAEEQLEDYCNDFHTDVEEGLVASCPKWKDKQLNNLLKKVKEMNKKML